MKFVRACTVCTCCTCCFVGTCNALVQVCLLFRVQWDFHFCRNLVLFIFSINKSTNKLVDTPNVLDTVGGFSHHFYRGENFWDFLSALKKKKSRPHQSRPEYLQSPVSKWREKLSKEAFPPNVFIPQLGDVYTSKWICITTAKRDFLLLFPLTVATLFKMGFR